MLGLLSTLALFITSASKCIQVMGHLKTISIFVISWQFLNEQYPAIKLFGVLVTSLGIISYSVVTLREKSQGSGSKAV